MSYHIIITDNETGETFIDTDTCAFIGALDDGEKGTRELSYVKCKCSDVAATALGAIESAAEAAAQLPTPWKKEFKKLTKKIIKKESKNHVN